MHFDCIFVCSFYFFQYSSISECHKAQNEIHQLKWPKEINNPLDACLINENEMKKKKEEESNDEKKTQDNFESFADYLRRRNIFLFNLWSMSREDRTIHSKEKELSM